MSARNAIVGVVSFDDNVGLHPGKRRDLNAAVFVKSSLARSRSIVSFARCDRATSICAERARLKNEWNRDSRGKAEARMSENSFCDVRAKCPPPPFFPGD